MTTMKVILKRLQKKMLRDGTGDCKLIICLNENDKNNT